MKLIRLHVKNVPEPSCIRLINPEFIVMVQPMMGHANGNNSGPLVVTGTTLVLNGSIRKDGEPNNLLVSEMPEDVYRLIEKAYED